MLSKSPSFFGTSKLRAVLLRLGGIAAGAITGVLLSAILYIFLVLLLHLFESSAPLLAGFGIVGGVIGSVFGFFFPKRMLELAWNTISSCIPGI